MVVHGKCTGLMTVHIGVVLACSTWVMCGAYADIADKEAIKG